MTFSVSTLNVLVLPFFSIAKRFDDVVGAVREICNHHDAVETMRPTMDIPSYALQVGNHLKRVANVIIGNGMREGNKELKERKLSLFVFLFLKQYLYGDELQTVLGFLTYLFL